MRGRYLTIKIMKRHPEAPVEPPKFLGHGYCETFAKSSPIAGPGGAATSDEHIIGEVAWRLLNGFNFAPKELRGIAIQMQKLEAAPKPKTNPTQQLELSPKGQHDMGGITSERDRSRLSQEEDNGEQDPTAESGDDFRGPSSSFLEALPPDIRVEVETQYIKEPVKKAKVADDIEVEEPGQKDKGPLDTKRMAQIIQALAPRSAGSNPLSKTGKEFFNKRRDKLDISQSVLEKLGIDPEVFSMLPISDQKEQLSIFRARQ